MTFVTSPTDMFLFHFENCFEIVTKYWKLILKYLKLPL